MRFRNPCKKCLVNACCTTECTERKKFKEFFNLIIQLNVIFSFLIFALAIYFVKYKYIWIVPFILNILIYLMIHKRLPRLTQVVIFFIFGPFLFIFLVITLLFEKILKVNYLRTLKKGLYKC